MHRILLIISCIAGTVFSYSTGAPDKICTNGLVPDHHTDPQSSAAPYSFSGDGAVKSGNKISLSLEGDDFLGFAVQAHNAAGKPIGQFKTTDGAHSQTLKCSGDHDTLTHKKIDSSKPLKSVKFDWIAPQDYKGSVKFIATVAKNGGTFWVGKVLKDVKVE